MASSYSVKAVLSAVDKNFSATMVACNDSAEHLRSSISSGLGFGAMAAIGSKAVSTVGAALKSVTVTAVNAGMSFENAMSSVAAISGATGDAFDALTEKAKEMGATTQYTATESANAMEYMAMAGWKTEDMLAGIEGIMDLAAASGADLAATSDIVTDALTAFGKSASDSGMFADVMAAASANANTNVELMGETFKYVGPVAGALKYSIQDVALATGLMANSGIKGSQAGTALRQVMSRMAKPTKETDKAMSALGMSLTKSDGSMKSFNEVMKDMRKGMQGLTEDQQASYAAMLGGQEAMSGLLAIANASDEDFEKLAKSINESTGAAKEMAGVKLDNLKGDVTILQSALEGLGITAFGQVKDSLRGLAQEGISAVDAINKKLSEGEYIKKTLQWLSELGSAVKAGDLEGVLQQVGSLLDGASEKTGTLGAVLGALGIVTKASDFFHGKTWAIVSTGIKSANSALKEIPGAAKTAGKSIASHISGSKVAGKIKSSFGKITSPIKDLMDAATLDGANGIQKIGVLCGGTAQKIAATLQKVTGVTLSTGSKMMSGLTSMMGLALKALMPAALIAVVLAGLGLLYQTFGTQIDSILELAQTKGPQFITNLVNGIASRLPELIQQGGHLVSGLLDTITANLPALIQGGVTLVQSLVTGLISALPELISSAVNLVSTLIMGIASALPQLIMTGMELLLALAQGITANLPTMLDSAIQALTSFAQGILENLPSILTTAAEIIGTLAQGIIGAIPQLVAAIPEVLSAMIETIMATDWISVGKQVVSAIGEGIFGGLANIGGSIGDFFGNISDWFAGGKKGGESVTSGTVSAIDAGSSAVSSSATALGTAATDSTAAGIESGLGSVTASAEGIGTAATKGIETGMKSLGSVATSTMGKYSSAISNEESKAAASAEGVSKSVSSALKTAEPAALRSGQTVGSNMANGIKSKNSYAASSSKALTTAVKEPLANVNTYQYGAHIGTGLANGIRSQTANVRSASAQLAAAAEAAIRAKAKIHSPSRVTDKLGTYFGMGWVNSILNMVKDAKKAAMQLVQIPELATVPDIGMVMSGSLGALDANYDYTMSGTYTIYIPVEVDGRQVAKATATYTKEEIERQDKREQRKQGRV